MISQDSSFGMFPFSGPGKAALSDSSVSLEKPIIESEEKEHDYYAILEIPNPRSCCEEWN